MINRTKILLTLTSILTCSTGFAATSDCASLINSDKNTFLQTLRAGSAQIYYTLHECVQNNFCANYTGSATCLPTLNNYAAYAAYYAAAQHSHATNISSTLSDEQKHTIQQSLPTNDAPQKAQQVQESKQQKAEEKTGEKVDSGGNFYDNINF